MPMSPNDMQQEIDRMLRGCVESIDMAITQYLRENYASVAIVIPEAIIHEQAGNDDRAIERAFEQWRAAGWEIRRTDGGYTFGVADQSYFGR